MSGAAHSEKTIFISYSRKDTAFAETLKNDLRAAGATIWIDHERLQAGHPDWQAAIRRGIAAADAFIYIASPDAAESVYVRAEVRIAQEDARANQTLAIIPVWARGDPWSRCAPFELILAHYLDARGAKYSAARDDLLKTLGLPAQTEPAPPTPATLTSLRDATQRGRYVASPSWLPVYVLLDCSAGMRGAPIEALREGMQLLYDALMSKGELRSMVKLSIITFATGATQTPLVPIKDFTPPLLQAEGVTRLDGALHVLADSIEQDVRLNTVTARGDYQPVVFLFLGSNPTDAQGNRSNLYQAELQRLRAFRYNQKPTILAIACSPNVDMAVLKDITSNVLRTQDMTVSHVRDFLRMDDD